MSFAFSWISRKLDIKAAYVHLKYLYTKGGDALENLNFN